MKHHYSLIFDKEDTRKLATIWLFLGIFSLLASGLFSILLVLSRTPAIQEVIPFIDFFHTALVVHVDLSVLIWFTSFASILWTYGCDSVTKLDWSAVYLSIVGMLMMIITPFVIMDSQPLMNNYIPVLQTPFFIAGLAVYSLGVLLRIGHTLISPILFSNSFPTDAEKNNTTLNIGVYIAAITAAIAYAVFLLTLFKLPLELDAHLYFETLFWGSGHIIQFTHMILMFVVWIILLQGSQGQLLGHANLISSLFVVSFIPVLFSPYILFQYELLSPDLLFQFTQLMKYGSLTALPLGAVILLSTLRTKNHAASGAASNRHLKYSLWCSIALFAAGGILGFMIEGVNVVIPAHYHGSIVGITLAFMGFSYYLLPRLGYPLSPGAIKLAKIQPLVYALGQFMHISGLAWSGGYGVQRKTAGTAQGLERLPEIAGMALMGLGGLIAIIGGIIFVVVAIMAFRHKNRVTN